MLRPILLCGAALLAFPALAQTTPPEDTTPPAAPESDNRQAILDDAAATTPRTGETDVGATSTPTMPASSRAYPPCSRTVTDSCIQTSRRRPRR